MAEDFHPVLEPRYRWPWRSTCHAKKRNLVAQHVFIIEMRGQRDFCSLKLKRMRALSITELCGRCWVDYVIVVVILVRLRISVLSRDGEPDLHLKTDIRERGRSFSQDGQTRTRRVRAR